MKKNEIRIKLSSNKRVIPQSFVEKKDCGCKSKATTIIKQVAEKSKETKKKFL